MLIATALRHLTMKRAAVADHRREMTDFSPEAAIAMEERHLLEGGARIARQEEILKRFIERGQEQAAESASDLLTLLREMLEMSKARVLELKRGSATGAVS